MNFAIAWALLQSNGFGPHGPTHDYHGTFKVVLFRLWHTYAPPGYPDAPENLGLCGGRWGCQSFDIGEHANLSGGRLVTRDMLGVWSGWPAMTMAAYKFHEVIYDKAQPWKGPLSQVEFNSPGAMWFTAPWTTDNSGKPLRFLFRPLWFGTAVNSVLCGALAWLTWTGTKSVRKRIRARRSSRERCCPICHYDLQGELQRGCSECGWNRPL